MSERAMNESNQYLSFRLAEETFAMNVAQVREILDFTTVTKVPQTPPYMRGVINLRGSVVPVLDLRLKFGMSQTENTVNSCIVVVELQEGAVVGVLTDAVQEVLDIEPDQIEPAPRLGTKLNKDFILGMGRHDDQFIMILDVDRIFCLEDVGLTGDEPELDEACNG
ncbi:chemotaxis protein CheW [Geomesophilobacter sediminis]|uniref:Purine-binding chemotaxis protein CheW n=1 Tax=Geomesophilobacter sediminis TaxID=2798584 RepID=A0A8J7IM93_9BACT|nr:chemotaxis protein CheW [Geomesophilobacter sediminis]MBJ6723783.1 purine-binding chemotaxis protein CheW [Geomesophilobacter sediminis]